ncbi:SRA-YDG domain-containing protein [Corchorus capsularis]|uniref:SRA-YDG domain-containing protein n=1 Tax=Corchorus capsularis TaxID=210143 RepID=A0A1R3JGB8_COCAP|nr:SRA-YDG domain-containing protein [Corchorus capsularis]
MVVQYWKQKGISGFIVFKYRLRRLEGQPTLTTSKVTIRHQLFSTVDPTASLYTVEDKEDR